MNSVSVRQAVLLSDLDALVPLFDSYRRFYGKAGGPLAAKALLRDRFEHGESVLFIASRDTEAVGFVQLYPCFSSVTLARTFILNDLFVDAGYRRLGIARRLLEAATEYSAALGAVRLTLSTSINNAEAQALYQADGWVRNEQFYVFNWPVPAEK